MKHLFWIVCGVIFLGLIGAWFVIVPTDEARQVKEKLDQQKKALLDLERRAKNGDPIGVFNAEIEDDTKKLQENYLITEQWKRVLEPHVKKYEDQLGQIQAHLAERSRSLHKPITDTSAKLEWYEAYFKTSEGLLGRLREAGIIAQPAGDAFPGGGQRSQVGLFTRGADFPDPKEHPLITTRYRVLELLTEILGRAQAPIASNPVTNGTGPEEERGKSVPRLVQVEWNGDAPEGVPFSTQFTSLVSGRAYHLRLSLEGTLAGLLAATAALEHNPDPGRPLVLVTSAALNRKAGFSPGERFNIPAETARLNLEVAVLDFGANP